MAADRIWKLYPVASGRPDSEFDRVWVEDTAQVAIAPLPRDQVAVIESGVHILRNAGEPVSTRTLRIRYRVDISTDSLFEDESGRFWMVSGFEEVGRRRWLDVSVTHYELAQTVTPPDPVDPQMPSAAPQPGWTLQDRTGAAVRVLTIASFVLNARASRVGVRFLVPAGGWEVGPGFDITATYSVEDAQGRDTLMTVVNTEQDEIDANLEAGDQWPGGNARVFLTRDGVTNDVSGTLDDYSIGDQFTVTASG